MYCRKGLTHTQRKERDGARSYTKPALFCARLNHLVLAWAKFCRTGTVYQSRANKTVDLSSSSFIGQPTIIYDCCVSLVSMKTTTLFLALLEIQLYRLVAASQSHSQPIVVSPAHHYNCDSTTHASFHPIPLLPDTLVPSYTLKAVPTTVYRRRSQEYLKHPTWEPVEILGPDIQDKHTLSQLARISGNAYALPGQKNWYDVDSAWNVVSIHLFYPSSICLITQID